jgi:hypothetical protein
MKINAIIMGSTRMIGKGVLFECLENDHVESVLLISRQSCNIRHHKIREIIHEDFHDFSTIINELTGYNACFFCLGVSSAGMAEKDYYKITYDLTINFARTILPVNPELVFCYISGAGTDTSEKGRMMWAQVKGKTENTLLAMPFKAAYMFRPGFIQPMKGITSRTKGYNLLYIIFKPLYYMLRQFRGLVTNTELLGKAMINTVFYGCDKTILATKDINILSAMD